MAVLMGLIYLQVPYDDRRLQNITGVLFFVVTNSSLVNLFAVVQVRTSNTDSTRTSNRT